MKKKFREITVNNSKYTWAVTNYNGDGDGGFSLKIWQNKQEIYNNWTNNCKNSSITPKFVENIIKIL